MPEFLTDFLLEMSYDNRRNLGLAIALRALYRYTELFGLYRTGFAGGRTDA